MNHEQKLKLIKKAAEAKGLIWIGEDKEGLFLHSCHRKGYPVIFNPIDDSGCAFNLMLDLDIHMQYDLGINEFLFSWFDGEKTCNFTMYAGMLDKDVIARLGITMAASMMIKEDS